MHSLGLKLNITGTLVLLLTIAVLLGNVVVVLFWHRGLVLGEVRHAQTIAGVWSELIIRHHDLQDVSPGDLEFLCKAAGVNCRGVVFYNGSALEFIRSYERYLPLEEATMLAAKSGVQVIRFADASMGGFFFGNKRLIVAFPITLRNQQNMGLGMVVTLKSAYQLFRQHQKIVIVYMLVNIALLTIVGLFRMINLVVRPIERLVETSEAYDNSDELAFLGERSASEIGQLSLALNRMLSRIEKDRDKLRLTVKSLEQVNAQLINTQKEMVRAEKLAAVGRLSAGLAHEIGNPIGIVQGYLELLENEDLSSEERIQFSRRSIGELQRINNLIHQLLDFSRSTSQEPAPVEVQALLAEVIQMYSTQSKAPEINFVGECAGQEDVVVANALELQQVFLNCLLNASDSIQEMGSGYNGRIEVSCKCLKKEKPLIRIMIADNGAGIEPKFLETIFDPFFTTKAPGKGTGLGLSVSYSIIEAAGGRIWAESTTEAGAAIIIELPTA